MPSRHRQASIAILAAAFGCSVYDASLLVGGAGAPGFGPSSGATGGSVGGAGGKGGTAGSGTTSGGSAGSGTSGGSGGAGGSTGGADASGGKGGTGGSTGGTSGGTDASGGTGDEGGDGGTGNQGSGGDTSGSGGGGTGGDGAGSGGTGGSTGGTGGPAGSGGTAAGQAGSSGMGGSAGTGGSSGAGGSAGTGGSSGAGGSAGTGGSSGAGGSGGGTGCAVLTTALDAADDKAHYLITLAADTDFSAATVSLHVYVTGATGGTLFMYVQQPTYEFWGENAQALTGFSGWKTINWNVGSETTTGVDKTLIRRLGIEVNGAGSTTWANPTTVYIDSITVTSAALSFPFDASATVNTTATSAYSTDTALWMNSSASDTTALTGSSVAWSATCP